jgi:hypothetical protein
MCKEVDGGDEAENKAVKATLPRPGTRPVAPNSDTVLAPPPSKARRLTTNPIAVEKIETPGAAITDIDLSPVSD